MEYFCHKSLGRIQFDPKNNTRYFEPWWALVHCDRGICDLYCWFLKKYGIETDPNRLWGAHISAIKGEQPIDKELWGNITSPIEFWYTNQIRWDNRRHAWLDVYSPQLAEIRRNFGLTERDRFHITLGRLKRSNCV